MCAVDTPLCLHPPNRLDLMNKVQTPVILIILKGRESIIGLPHVERLEGGVCAGLAPQLTK